MLKKIASHIRTFRRSAASSPTAKTDEDQEALQTYLEKYAADGFKRELDLEEAVWRSVPALVSAIGLLGAGLVFLCRSLAAQRDPLEPAFLIQAVLLSGALIALGLAAWHLRFAVSKRKHRYPTDEVDLCKWAGQLKGAYEVDGHSPGEAARRTLADVKTDVLKEVAAAASHNHQLNVAKMKGRTESARWIFHAAVIMLAAVLVSTFARAEFWKTPDELEAPAVAASSAAAAGADVDPKPGPSLGREGRDAAAPAPLTRSTEGAPAPQPAPG
jgi:hypothetical protein